MPHCGEYLPFSDLKGKFLTVFLHLKEKKKRDKSAGLAECFQIANSVLFLESWNRGGSPQLQFYKAPIQKEFSFTHQTLVHLSHPLIECEASFWSPHPSVPSFFSISWSQKNHLGCPQMNRWSDDPPSGLGREEYLLMKSVLRPYSLSSAQGWRFCRAYREELWAHSGSDTADSLRDFWRADCCSCRMRRLACWRSASLSSAVCLLKEARIRWTGVQ